MSRITISTGEAISEIFAPRTELYWDPLTGEGRVVFHMEKFTTMEGVQLSKVPCGTLVRPLDSLLLRTFDAELPDGQGGVQIVPTHGAVVMATMKAVFNQIFQEQFEADQILPPANGLGNPVLAVATADTQKQTKDHTK